MIKGTSICETAYAVAGKFSKCSTIYHADHEYSVENSQPSKRLYLNSVKYLKAGQTLWVDRVFSSAILNAIYSFHGSAAAYTEYWNCTFINTYSGNIEGLSRRQIWKAFIEESIRMVATESQKDLVLEDNISVEKVTQGAYQYLGGNGKIALALDHTCAECTQPYKERPDFLTNDDPAAIVGVDENQPVPVLIGEGAFQAYIDRQNAQQNAMQQNREDINPVSAAEASAGICNMVVVDGIVMGVQHCAFEGCSAALTNARGGVFCETHELAYGDKCRIRGCEVIKIQGTQACMEHQPNWQRFIQQHTRENFTGARRMLHRPDEENIWQLQARNNIQPHDEDAADNQQIHPNYFTVFRFYCVETICAPCGVVIAWTKFARAESPTNIVNFLTDVYPDKQLRPSYICIDKACLVLRTILANPDYNEWLDTTRLVVDVYHYKNHRTSDYLCRKWCNPAPLNGSAPNLVIVANDNQGRPYYKRAFNTQVYTIYFLYFIRLVNNLMHG